MLTFQPLDLIPYWLVFPLTVGLGLLAEELGFRLGRWRNARSGLAKDPTVAVMLGAALALLAFLLAFLVGVASDRFGTRRGLVVTDANAIGTTELRARYLPEPYRSSSRSLLKEYVDLRVAAARGASLESARARAEEIQGELWQSVEAMVRENPGSVTLALYIEALNHMIDVHSARVTAVYARVPPTVLLGVYLVGLLAMLLIGVNNSNEGRQSWIALVVLVVMFGAVITVIIDLDRPTEGFLTINQAPMYDLQIQLTK